MFVNSRQICISMVMIPMLVISNRTNSTRARVISHRNALIGLLNVPLYSTVVSRIYAQVAKGRCTRTERYSFQSKASHCASPRNYASETNTLGLPIVRMHRYSAVRFRSNVFTTFIEFSSGTAALFSVDSQVKKDVTHRKARSASMQRIRFNYCVT